MSQAAAQAAAFYREVGRNRRVWTVRDGGGFPAPLGDGERAMPFWSSAARANRIVAKSEAWSGFEVVELTLDDFRDKWLPGLERDGLRVGVNWTGVRATGYDAMPSEVRVGIEAALSD